MTRNKLFCTPDYSRGDGGQNAPVAYTAVSLSLRNTVPALLRALQTHVPGFQGPTLPASWQPGPWFGAVTVVYRNSHQPGLLSYYGTPEAEYK